MDTSMDMSLGRAGSGPHHILMCCDGRYIQHAAVFLRSLLHHCPDRRFHVVVACNDLTPETTRRFEETFRPFPRMQIRLSRVLGDGIEQLPIHSTLTPESWGRLWIEDYFPPDVTRAFYFDPDIVVTGAMDELLDIDLSGHLLAAVTIPGSVRAAVHGYDPRFEYFNSGVLAINLEKWRAIGPREQLIAYTARHPERVNDPDQDALNGCFHADRLPLDYVWNAIAPFFRSNTSLPLPPAELRRIRQDVRLVHFNGPWKPWLFMCNHPRKPDYVRFLRLTAWRGYRYPDVGWVNRLKKALIVLFGDVRMGQVKQALVSLRR